MTGKEICEVMEQLNPTKQQEEQMYQNILSSYNEQEYHSNRKEKKTGTKGKTIGYGRGMRYAAACLLLLVLLPTITYAAFHSVFLEKFFDTPNASSETQDEEWLAQYIIEEPEKFSYGGYLFYLQGYLINSQIGEGMLLVNVKKEKETDYCLWEVPEGNEKASALYMGASSESVDLSGDKEFKNRNLSKIIQFLPDAGNTRKYEYRKTGEDSYEYKITFYSDYQTIAQCMQSTHSPKQPINLNFYDGTGNPVGTLPLNQCDEFTAYHWLSPSGQNNVIITPFMIYASGVPGRLLTEENQVIAEYQDGRKKELSASITTGYNEEHNTYKTLGLDDVVNTNELKAITIHTEERDWCLDVDNAQQ